MWFEQHPYISTYLVGSVLVVVLILIKSALFWFLNWITKEHVVYENIKKIQPPGDYHFTLGAGTHVSRTHVLRTHALSTLFEALFSWISVLIVIWQIFAGIFRKLREALTTVPEEIKRLRFPLWNNPDMSRESVWAYSYAINIKFGTDRPSASDIAGSLDELAFYYDHLDRGVALEQLRSLNVVSNDIISKVQKYNDADSDYSRDEELSETN